MRRVLLAVDASTPDLTPDDRLLAAALERREVEARPVRADLLLLVPGGPTGVPH